MSLQRLWRMGLCLILVGCSASESLENEEADPSPKTTTRRAKDSAIEQARRIHQADRARSNEEKILILKQVIEANPRHRQALFQLARLTQDEALRKMIVDCRASIPACLESARFARNLKAAHDDLQPEEAEIIGIILFNEACSLALLGKQDEAMASLEEAINVGYQDLSNFRFDPEMALLRDHPRFDALAQRLETTEAETRNQNLARSIEQARADLNQFRPFPFAFRLPDLDNQLVSSTDFQGHLTILNFWGPSYLPSLQEIPHLVDLQTEYEDQGLKVVGLAFEKGSTEQVRSTIRQFRENSKINYPILIGDAETRQMLPDFSGYPTTVFLDPAGRVRLILVGYSDKTRIEGVVLVLLNENSELLEGLDSTGID